MPDIKTSFAMPHNDAELGLCPRCGKPLSESRDKQITKIVNVICLFFALVALAVAWYVRGTSSVKVPTTRTSLPRYQFRPSTIYSNTKGVTYAQFLKLKPGMKSSQVNSILGSVGTMTSRTRIAGVATEIYHWQNPNGSNLSVVFQKSALAAKARFKLEPSSNTNR